MHEALNHAKLAMLFRKEFELCNVGKGETIVLLSDLAARRLRMVDPRTFPDDSLRVLRAIQFAARFELTLDEATRDLCRTIALDDLPLRMRARDEAGVVDGGKRRRRIGGGLERRPQRGLAVDADRKRFDQLEASKVSGG